MASMNGGEGPEDDEMAAAELRLLACAAAERAEMRAALGTQRDNWNKLFQHTLTAALMAATVLAALAGPTAPLAALVPAFLLDAVAAAMMSAINRFQPSQLAEEQRAAGRLYRKLAADAEFHAVPGRRRLPQQQRPQTPARVALPRLRRRLAAIDRSFPMPLTPGGLDKFPSQIHPPVIIAAAHDYYDISAAHDYGSEHIRNKHNHISKDSNNIGNDGSIHRPHVPPAGRGWNEALEAELRGVAELLARSDVRTYTRWARNVVRINKALAAAAPSLAAAAGLLNAARIALVWAAAAPGPMPLLGSAAAVCSAAAALVASFSHDMQMGMVAELYRSSAGYYASLRASVEEMLGTPVEHREHGALFRWRVAYALGRFPAAAPPDDAIVPPGASSASALF